MRCAKIERWISDDIDGALAPRKKDIVARHLSSCPSCRAYRVHVMGLQAGALEQNRAAERPDAYWREFGARLEERLGGERPFLADRARLAARRSWVWSGAGLAAAAALAAYLLVLRPDAVRPGPFVFSFEDTVASIMTEIGDDPELERSFGTALQASIDEAVGEAGGEAFGSPSGDPLFWESLSDEELARVESGLRSEK